MGEPVEQLAKCHMGQYLASCGHDQKVKFWDISSLSSVIVDDYRKKKKNKQLKPLSRKAFGNGEDFFADLKEVAADLEKEENGGLSETDSDWKTHTDPIRGSFPWKDILEKLSYAEE